MTNQLGQRSGALEALARSYLPEWRFSAENPDPGSVVALLVDNMLAESETRLGQAMHKYRIQYLNLFDRLKEEPLESAKSFVRFTQVVGMEQPVHVPRGTRLIADSAEQRLIFETSYSITTTQAQLVSVYATDLGSDRIVCLSDQGRGSKDDGVFKAFDLSAPNQAEHLLLLAFDTALDVMDGVSFGLRIDTTDPEDREAMINLLCRENVRYSLLEPDGEHFFDTVTRQGDLIWLTAQHYAPQKVVLEGKERYVLCLSSEGSGRIEINNAELVFSQENLPPDEVVCGGVARQPGRFMPFGSPMEIYSECGIECRGAFARRGADMTMQFHLDFVPLEQNLPETAENLDLKIIMKKPTEAAKVEATLVRADYVLLEYRSDRGWRRLLMDEHTAMLFNGSAEGNVSINFTLPHDIVEEDGAPRLRLRLLNADGLYSIPSVQYCPQISGLSFSYRYEEGRLTPDYACTRNNFEVVDVTDRIRRQKDFILFYSKENAATSMYLGFDSNPQGLPLSIYFEIENDEDVALDYTMEYLSPQGFTHMQMVDNTGGMLYSGTLLLPVPSDCTKKEMFGRACYWLRIALKNDPKGELPVIKNVLTNMVRVENLRSETETFYISDPDAALRISLAEQGLVSVEVYVNEEDGDPENRENWVRWSRRTGFDQRGRYCDIDPATGTVNFAKHAFAPYPTKEGLPAVKVVYQSFQGSAANVLQNEIVTMQEPLRYISAVTNPMAAYGGYDGLTEETAAAVISNMLRTRNRAVTSQDYFDIISQVSYGVKKIKCVSGVNRMGENADDSITIALLIDEYDKGSHIFSAVKDTIRDKLLESSSIVPMGKNLVLSQPYFVRFSVRIWLDCPPSQDPYELQQTAQQDIVTFIDPLTGGFEGKGWDIGVLPTVRHLTAWLKVKRPGLAVSRIVMSARSRGREYAVDDDISKIIGNPFAMAVNGEHIVYVELPK